MYIFYFFYKLLIKSAALTLFKVIINSELRVESVEIKKLTGKLIFGNYIFSIIFLNNLYN